MSWLTQYFLNPGYVLPGAALAALPIIIHLLSRLRYKRVRFAAMEFLLQSDELNRRRLIIEQLLLLLLRVLAVLLIMFLIARLILDPSRLMLLRGASTHHVLVLDDSLSMRVRAGDGTLFDQAVQTLEKLLSQGEGRSGSLRVTVLTMTAPDRPLITDRELDGALVQELIPRLRNLRCSFTAASPVPALQAAENVLKGDGGVAPQVHVITDLRQSDWMNRPEVVAAFKSLDAIDAGISLIQLTSDSPGNVVLSRMTSETLAVAVGVPWRLNLTLKNHSAQRSSGLRATVDIDGTSLPIKVLVPDIDPGEETTLSHDIVFDAAGQHEVEVQLEEDALLEDNSRFIVVDVTDKRRVLVVDDEAKQDDAGFVSAALSADPQLTGVASEIRTSDVLTSAKLDEYDCVFLLNVRELPADATVLLAEYVRNGGGLAWFPDSQANTTWYNTALRSADQPLFPVPLGTVETIPDRSADEDPAFQHPVFEQHPIFAVYNIPDSPFADLVQVSQWFQVSSDWNADDSSVPDVRVLARLENGAPVIFEHALGSGRILTFLTTAGRRWSNWPVSPAGPGYVVMNLLMHQYLQKPTDSVQVREPGEPIRFEWPAGQYSESVEVFLPDVEGEDKDSADTFLRLQAAPVRTTTDSDAGKVDSSEAERMAVSIPQASRPGVYRVKRFPVEGESDETWLALSVPATESDLTAADATAVQQQANLNNLRVIAADTAAGLSASDAGREMRWFLIGLLITVLVCEQLLSLRLSFHPEVKA
ncbi:MAG: BatA domain-containing protein [Planctomycetaceae bacterium]